MPDFNKSALTALNAISKNGRLLPLKRSFPIFDDVTGQAQYLQADQNGTISAITLARYKGVVLDEFDEAFKADLKVGRAKLLLAAAKGATFIPEVGDRVYFDSADWYIKGVSKLDLNGIPLIYTIGVIQK